MNVTRAGRAVKLGLTFSGGKVRKREATDRDASMRDMVDFLKEIGPRDR